MPCGQVYRGPAMHKQPRLNESARAAAILRPSEPTMRQLAVLDAYAEAGTYDLTAATTIQAYRAALAAGDLSTLGCHCLTVRP